MNYKAILFFGAPGTGKGTQGQMVGQIPGFLHTSTGDLFRALDKNSELGKVFADYSSKGLLVPDDFTIKLWKNHMDNLVKAGKFDPKQNIVIMDGVPRNVNQTNLLKGAIDVLKIIYLETADIDKMVARLKARALKSGRKDDADEKVIRNRMTVYANETAPVLQCYDKKLIASIEADQSIIRVFSEVVSTLVPIKEAVEKQA
jgi:adenylate kinase